MMLKTGICVFMCLYVKKRKADSANTIPSTKYVLYDSTVQNEGSFASVICIWVLYIKSLITAGVDVVHVWN